MKIRRGPMIVFVVLALIAAHAAWDYVEMRRYLRDFRAVQLRGEPVQGSPTLAVPARLPSGEAAESDRYYRAAAALVSGATFGSVISQPILLPKDYGYDLALSL